MPDSPISQILTNYGIPGYETTPLLGGGSWLGVHFDPNWGGARGGMPVPGGSPGMPPPPGGVPPPPPAGGPLPPGAGRPDPGTVTNPPTHEQQSMTKELGPGQGFQIPQAQPYTTSPYNQGYGGMPAPFANIHDQMGAAMNTIQPAYPTFRWAPGWMEMLGYQTPGEGPVNAPRPTPTPPVGQVPSQRPAPTNPQVPPGMSAPSVPPPPMSAPSANPAANQMMTKMGGGSGMGGYHRAGFSGGGQAANFWSPALQSQVNADVGLAGGLFGSNPAQAAAILGAPGRGVTARDTLFAQQHFGGDMQAYKSWLQGQLQANPNVQFNRNTQTFGR